MQAWVFKDNGSILQFDITSNQTNMSLYMTSTNRVALESLELEEQIAKGAGCVSNYTVCAIQGCNFQHDVHCEFLRPFTRYGENVLAIRSLDIVLKFSNKKCFRLLIYNIKSMLVYVLTVYDMRSITLGKRSKLPLYSNRTQQTTK